MKNKGRYWGFLVISLLCLIIDLVSWFTMDSSVSLVDSNMLIIYFTAIISVIVLIRCLVKKSAEVVEENSLIRVVSK